MQKLSSCESDKYSSHNTPVQTDFPPPLFSTQAQSMNYHKDKRTWSPKEQEKSTSKWTDEDGLDGFWLIFTLNKFVCIIKTQKQYFTAHYLRISSIFKRPTHKWNRKPKILHSLVGHCTHQRHNCCVSQKLPTIVLHYSQHQKTGQKLMTSEFPTSDVR